MKTTEFLVENEFIVQDADQMHKTHQHSMLREECYHLAVNAVAIHKLLGEMVESEPVMPWAAEYISLANDHIKSVKEFLEYNDVESDMDSDMPEFDSAIADVVIAESLMKDNDAIKQFLARGGQVQQINNPAVRKQGVAEGSISDLLNKDPTSPKFNDHSAPRKTKHSGSTPTPYEQGRLDAHRKKSYNNIHSSEQDAEDYKTGYRHVKSRQGVAEGSTTRGGFGGSASQAQHEIQWLKNKIETLKPLLAKKPSVARQIKDLERQIRERELAIAYQKEDVAEGLPQTLRKVVPGYAKREIDRKMDAGKFGKTDADKDANFQRYKKIQDKLKKQGVAEGIFDRFKKKQPAKPQRMPITDEQRAAIIQHFPTNHNANLKWGRKENDDYVLPDNVTVQFGKGIINFINYDGNLIASVAYYRSKEDRMNPKAIPIPLTHFDEPINSDKDLEQLKSNLVEGSLNEFAPDGFDGFEGDDRVPMHFIVEKDSYNPRSKWKKSYKPQGGGIALFTTKQEAIQAAEKFNKLDPNREFKYGGTQLVHVEDDDKQLDEFAPGAGRDDDFDPETANMAHQEGVVKGFSLVDGATVEQALQIPHCQWGKLYNGQYKQYFVKGFIDGRKAKLEQARKDGVELSLQKDGSLSRVQQGVAEGWIDDDAAEPLAKYFADLYYGDFSVTMKIKLAAHIYQSIQNGELTIEQLKAEIDMLEKEKGIKEQGVAEGSYDNDKGITHTRGSLVAKLEALPKGSDDFEWNRIQAIHQLKQGNMLRAKYYMALMKRSKQGVAEGLNDTQKKIEDTINKLEDRLKHAKTDEQWDRISARIERLQAGLKRSKQGVAEGSLNEFAIDKEPNGDNRSKLIGTIVQLLKSGKKVDFYVPGIRGHVVGSGGNGDWLTLKRWNKPYSKINYSLELDASDDSRFSLKMIKPDYYQVVQSEDMNQGVAEGEFTIKDDPSAHIRILFLKTINGNEYRLVKQGNVYKIYVNRSRKTKQQFPSFDLAKKALQQLLLNAVHTDDPVVAEGDNLTEFDPNEYSERYTVYMNREKIESFPDLEQAVEYVSDILEDEPNAYMFVWEIIDIDGKKVWEMDSHDYVKKNKITIGGKDVGGMLGGLLGVAEGSSIMQGIRIQENATGGSMSAASVGAVVTGLGEMPNAIIKRQKAYTNQRTRGGTVKVKQ